MPPGAQTVRVFGGAHLSVALALEPPCPRPRSAPARWSTPAALSGRLQKVVTTPTTSELHTQPVDLETSADTRQSRPRRGLPASLTANPDQNPHRQLHESGNGFAAAADLLLVKTDSTRARPHASARRLRNRSKRLPHTAAVRKCIAFHGPTRWLDPEANTSTRCAPSSTSWDGATPGKPRYTPALVLEPGVTG